MYSSNEEKELAILESGDDRDTLVDTQIIDTDNKYLAIGQDIIVSSVLTGFVEDTVKTGVYRLGGKQVLEKALGRYDMYVTPERLKRLKEVANQRITWKTNNIISKLASKKSAEKMLKTIGNQTTRVGTRLLARGSASRLATSVISSVLTVADLAFTIYTSIIDYRDEYGLQILWHQDYIDYISRDFKDTLKEAYKKLNDPEYMDTPVTFEPEDFMFDMDEELGIYYLDKNNIWASKFKKYENEYLKSIGIKDGWEDRIKLIDIDLPEIKKPINVKKVSKIGLVLSLFIISLIFIIILFVVII